MSAYQEKQAALLKSVIEHRGERMCLTEAGKALGYNHQTLKRKYDEGAPIIEMRKEGGRWMVDAFDVVQVILNGPVYQRLAQQEGSA